jgi:hypothetical protein
LEVHKKALKAFVPFTFSFLSGIYRQLGQIFEFQTQYPVTKLTLGNAMTTVRLQTEG